MRSGSIIENPDRQPIGIDLFAGAGGFSCGFKQAGWHVIAANENITDPDSRIMKTQKSWLQGYNAPAIVNKHQIVLATSYQAWYCEATLVHTLRHPLLLADLRREARLASWPALDLNLHALAFEIDPPTWRVLLELAHPLDRIDLRRHGGA